MRAARAERASGRWTAVPAALMGLLLTAGPVAAQARSDTIPPDAAHLHGGVMDVASGTGLTGAGVSITSLDRVGPPLRRYVETDDAGAFSFPPVEPGRYLLRIDALGYRTLRDTLRLAAASDTRIETGLVPEALDLEPLVVRVVRREPSFMRGFRERRAQGLGRFLDREEIEERNAFVASDLFRALPGFRVISGGAPGGAALAMRERCQPELYVDGIRAWGGVSLDALVSPHDIEAIEAYSIGSAPARFRRSGCGVVLVWTRVSTRDEGKRTSWARVAIVGGLFVVVNLLGG